MSKGPKPLTKDNVKMLADKADEFISSQDVIRNYKGLWPIFERFYAHDYKFKPLFEFLLRENVVTEDQRKSVDNAWNRFRAEKKNQSTKKENG